VEVHFEDGASNTLEWLHANVHANAHVTGGRASAGRLLWGCDDHIEAIRLLGRFDLILGSDLLYDPDQYAALRATLDAVLLDSRSVAIFGFTSRIGAEENFLKLASQRFSVDNVWHPSTGDGASRWASTVFRLP
jgi:predicted nicotinamide N-methyase